MNEEELNNIIKECINGDRKCQKSIFDLYSSRMMTVCLRYTKNRTDAEDVLQDGFIKVFTKMSQFGFKGSFEGWIRRVMVNSALRFLEKKKAFLPLDEGRVAFVPVIDNPGSGKTEQILKLVTSLPDGYRRILNMYVFEGYDHAEIAQVLGISASTSRSQLTKARKLLKSEMSKRNLS